MTSRAPLDRFRLLLAIGAVVSVLGLEPAAGSPVDVGLKKIDEAFMQTFLATRTTEPFVTGHFTVEEDSDPQTAEAAAECRERRSFRVLRQLDALGPDGRTAWQEYARYTLMLCQHGALSVAAFQATMDSAMQMINPPGKQITPEIAQFTKDIAGFQFRIGDRTGRAVVLMEIGHGILFAPIAVVPSADPRATLCVVFDDQHIGDPGHEIKRTLSDLADLLKAADLRSLLGTSR